MSVYDEFQASYIVHVNNVQVYPLLSLSSCLSFFLSKNMNVVQHWQKKELLKINFLLDAQMTLQGNYNFKYSISWSAIIADWT